MSPSVPVLVVAVKAPGHGKSRLVPPPGRERHELARAFALDTLEVVAALGARVRALVLTTDVDLGRRARARGLGTRADTVPGDLNASLVAVAAEHPEHRPILALCADLPSLRPEDLEHLLAGLPHERAGFVRDAEGTGTTAYAAPVRLFSPRFGAGSAHAHTLDGAVELGRDLTRLRTDVDDAEDLAHAARLGLGRHTTAVLRD